LQPLIENAIIHGFKGYESGGLLKVSGSKDGDYLKICIADNGLSMSQETLDQIDRDLQERRSFSGIGLKNVINRLRMYYGEAATINFSSRIGEGTIVTLVLPIL
jgi:two-component system sensor histidine kinase YesM